MEDTVFVKEVKCRTFSFVADPYFLEKEKEVEVKCGAFGKTADLIKLI